jgi:Zn-dependent protease with chaperone function
MAGSPDLRRRGWLAVGLLGGYYAMSIGIVLFCAAGVLIDLQSDRIDSWVIVVAIAVAGTVLRGLITLDRRGRDLEREGCVSLTRAEQPALWRLVDEVAEAVSSPPPSRVLLSADVNAAVLQAGSFLGLRAGQRVMILGLPLIATMSEDQLRAVLAHEYGHYLGGDTQVGAVLYRGAAGLERVIAGARYEFLRELYLDYYKFFVRVSRPVRRAQELEADALAARHMGAEPLRDGLASAAGIDAVWRQHLVESLQPGWALGLSVVDPFTHLGDLATRQQDLRERAFQAALKEPPDPFDSHPSLRERLERLGGVPSTLPATPGCLHLLANVAELESRLRRNLMPPAARAFAQTDVMYADLGEQVGMAIAFERARQLLAFVASLPAAAGEYGTLGHLLQVLSEASEEQRSNLARNTVGKGAPDPDAVLLADVRYAIGLALVQQEKATCEVATAGAYPYSFSPLGRAKLDVDDLAALAVTGRAGSVVTALKKAKLDLTWRPQLSGGTDIHELAGVLH